VDIPISFADKKRKGLPGNPIYSWSSAPPWMCILRPAYCTTSEKMCRSIWSIPKMSTPCAAIFIT